MAPALAGSSVGTVRNSERLICCAPSSLPAATALRSALAPANRGGGVRDAARGGIAVLPQLLGWTSIDSDYPAGGRAAPGSCETVPLNHSPRMKMGRSCGGTGPVARFAMLEDLILQRRGMLAGLS